MTDLVSNSFLQQTSTSQPLFSDCTQTSKPFHNNDKESAESKPKESQPRSGSDSGNENGGSFPGSTGTVSPPSRMQSPGNSANTYSKSDKCEERDPNNNCVTKPKEETEKQATPSEQLVKTDGLLSDFFETSNEPPFVPTTEHASAAPAKSDAPPSVSYKERLFGSSANLKPTVSSAEWGKASVRTESSTGSSFSWYLSQQETMNREKPEPTKTGDSPAVPNNAFQPDPRRAKNDEPKYSQPPPGLKERSPPPLAHAGDGDAWTEARNDPSYRNAPPPPQEMFTPRYDAFSRSTGASYGPRSNEYREGPPPMDFGGKLRSDNKFWSSPAPDASSSRSHDYYRGNRNGPPPPSDDYENREKFGYDKYEPSTRYRGGYEPESGIGGSARSYKNDNNIGGDWKGGSQWPSDNSRSSYPTSGRGGYMPPPPSSQASRGFDERDGNRPPSWYRGANNREFSYDYNSHTGRSNRYKQDSFYDEPAAFSGPPPLCLTPGPAPARNQVDYFNDKNAPWAGNDAEESDRHLSGGSSSMRHNQPGPPMASGAYQNRAEVYYPDPKRFEKRTLYVGSLHPIVNESELVDLFQLFGIVVTCKLHKEPNNRKYAFIEFKSRACAEAARIAMNQRKLHEYSIDVNWANTNSTVYTKKKLPQDKFGVFVGDIPGEFTNANLYQLFTQAFNNVVDARIVVEPVSQQSKQYGFVNFTVKASAEMAINLWNGKKDIDGRLLRLGWADRAQRNIPTKTYDEICRLPNFTKSNTTVYIGGVKEGVTEEKLRQIFSEFGEMREVRLFTEKGYAFISFFKHTAAQDSIRFKTGTQIEGHTIRCAWGRENNGPPDQGDKPGGAFGLSSLHDVTMGLKEFDLSGFDQDHLKIGEFGKSAASCELSVNRNFLATGANSWKDTDSGASPGTAGDWTNVRNGHVE